MRRLLNIVLVIVGIVGLILVRVLEETLFYDPFIVYFKRADPLLAVPAFNVVPLIFSHLFRFALNLFFASIIVQFLFNRKQWTVQALVLMICAFVLVFPIYLYGVLNDLDMGYMLTFYARRFVIQPMVLLIIIPMFYYRKKL